MEKNWQFVVRMLAGSMLVAALTAVLRFHVCIECSSCTSGGAEHAA